MHTRARARAVAVPLQSLKLVYALEHPPRARTRSERRGQAELKENDALSSLINDPGARARARARSRTDLSAFSAELISQALNAGDMSHEAYSPRFPPSDPDSSVRLRPRCAREFSRRVQPGFKIIFTLSHYILVISVAESYFYDA